MPYYPKNRIVTNQYSNPGNFTDENGKEYIGSYFYTFNGKYYSGANPQSNNIFQIFKIIDTKNPLLYGVNNTYYQNLKSNTKIQKYLEPESYYPQPTEEDYKKKNIIRYFAKERKVRSFKIIEINKITYDDIYSQNGIYNYPMWDITSLFWKISGPLKTERLLNGVINPGVIETNERLVLLKDPQFIGIKNYITDFQQFYKE